MKASIFLIRHGESLKNTLNTYTTASGKEPLTKYGKYQAESIADGLITYVETNDFKDVVLFSGNDIRSLDSAYSISKKLNIPLMVRDELDSIAGNSSSGKLAEELYEENPVFGESIRLYRAGLRSGYEVPWPSVTTMELEHILSPFLEEILVCDDTLSIVISHKSIITCLAIQLLRKFGQYPLDYYGYVDIPLGTGFLFEINNDTLKLSIHTFAKEKKKTKTDVVVDNGIIRFPESACAICWEKDKLLLVKQSRPGRDTWELPGGKIELLESPIEAAARELTEETGFAADNGKLLLSLDLDLSISFHRIHLVEFTHICHGAGKYQNAAWIGISELDKLINMGIITHAPTITAYLLEKNRREMEN